MSTATEAAFADAAPLEARIDALGLRENVRELDEFGYTVLQDPVALTLTDRVREAILRLAQESDGSARGYSAALLLGRDPVFDEAVLVPQLQVIVEQVVGRGALLSQLIGSVRPKGAVAIGLHADNSWFPAPFPEWDFLVTACWVTDEFTRDGGCTLVIPGSHREGRHPTSDARKTLANAIPIECEKGSLAVWNSRIWQLELPAHHGWRPRRLAHDLQPHWHHARGGLPPPGRKLPRGQAFRAGNAPRT